FVARLEVTRLTRELEAARERDNTRIHELDRARQDAIDARRDLAVAREEFTAELGETWRTAYVYRDQARAATERAEKDRGEALRERQMREASDRNCQVATERAERATELLLRAFPFINVNSGRLRDDVGAFLSSGATHPATKETP